MSAELGVSKGTVFSFQQAKFAGRLIAASRGAKGPTTVYFPNKNGDQVGYVIRETPVLSSELSKKYPEIKSYSGKSITDDAQGIRFSVSPDGVQAMIMHRDGRENSFIQKIAGEKYVLYSRGSENQPDADFICYAKDELALKNGSLTAKPVDEQVLRTYRLAVSATGEYSREFGGTVAGALAAINATITRVNAVFETDLAVRLELVDNTDEVIYTNRATDPYSGSLAVLGTQGQETFSDIIGEANYDIGHVFHRGSDTGNSGFIGAICVDGQKGSAYSSSRNPQGDVFDLDFVAHEMGHQLGANHSWSFELEDTGVQVEPGSGSTIMGYAGITADDNVAENGDDYFHYISIDQIIENLRAKTCGEITSIENTPPVVTPLPNYSIPKATAFLLDGDAADADPDNTLTYTWEQIDNGIVATPNFGPTNLAGANFRSRPPTTESFRYFPSLSQIVAGALTQTEPTIDSSWETVSTLERDLNFAFTVRDNAAAGGQVVSELTTIAVTNQAGPFVVTSQAGAERYRAGQVIGVEWNVANTNRAPVNAQLVDILLSTDGGLTFSETLAEGVLNDGSQQVQLPGVAIASARIMVKATDHVFLAVNASDFLIEASEIVLNLPELEFTVCQFETLTLPFTYESYLGFDQQVTFNLTGVAENLLFAFTPQTATQSDTPVNILFENTENVTEGIYELILTATSGDNTEQVPFTLTVLGADFPDVELTSPANASTEISTDEVLRFNSDATYTAYEIQIATDNAFTEIVEGATVFKNSYTGTNLDNDTRYFWRVKPLNDCGEGNFGEAFSFNTIAANCDNRVANGLPIAITPARKSTIRSSISFFEDKKVADLDVNLKIDHRYIEDLRVTLTSPSNTSVALLVDACGNLENIDAVFDDAADEFICGVDADAGVSGRVKPRATLAAFNGESIFGRWVLEVQDVVRGDGGNLVDFSLDICVEGDFRPDDDQDGVFDDGDDLCLDTPSGVQVNTSGCQIFRFPEDNFLITTQSLSCRNKNDGAITITAGPGALADAQYDVVIIRDDRSITGSFTTNAFSAENLFPGMYSVCINGMAAGIPYEEYCFEVNITEPEALAVTSNLSAIGNQVTLALEGADAYTVTLNGETLRTEKQEITLNLMSGKNKVAVSTDQKCQGSFETEYVLADGPVAFPNPFSKTTQLFLGTAEEKVSIGLFTTDGVLVQEAQYITVQNIVDVDFTGLPAGVYIIKFKGKYSSGTTKVIKR